MIPVMLCGKINHLENKIIDKSACRLNDRYMQTNLYRSIAENAKDGIGLITAEGKLVYLNPTAKKILGVNDLDLVLGKDALEFHPPDTHPQIRQAIASLQNEDSWMGEVEMKNLLTQEVILTEFHAFSIRSATGEVTHLGTVFRDISWKKERNVEISRLSQIVNQAAEAIFVTDLRGQIMFVNPAFEHITGYMAQEVIGQNPRLLKSGRHDENHYKAMWATLSAGNVWRGSLVNRKKNGEFFHEKATISQLKDTHTGKPIGYLSVSLDVTKEVNLEAQLQHAQRLESIGRLAGGVAHDFNNILAVITADIEILKKEIKHDDGLYEVIEEIDQSAKHAATLTKQLLAFSRRQVVHPIPLNLNDWILNIKKLLKRIIGEDVEFDTRLADRLSLVEADPAQLEQVIINLVVNARDAMPKGGRLIIETAEVAFKQNSQEGPMVMMAISDTGDGMDAETQSHIFEPFFTTKKDGKGTGLGLAMVYGIIKQLNGNILVYSEPGIGTTFKIYFPTTQARPRPSEIPKPTKSRSHQVRRAKILLVEDEELVRKSTKRILERAGHDVRDAHDGEDAIRISENENFDLLITDLVMPRLGGKELSESLNKRQPHMKVLLMSGYSEGMVMSRGKFDAEINFIEKPFEPKDFLDKIQDMLAEDSEVDASQPKWRE